MTRSMTAFARAELGCAVWEIRSVNHRYLDVSFRLPDNFRRLEAELKSTFKNRVYRGKLECNLNVKAAALNTGLSVNEELVAELKRAMTRVSELSGLDPKSDALALMRWPDVLVNAEDTEELDSDVLGCFETAVVALTGMREREGQELADLIETRLKEVESIVHEVTAAAPRIEAGQHAKLLARLEKLDVESDPARLEQELVILAQKHDVMEELDRQSWARQWFAPASGAY